MVPRLPPAPACPLSAPPAPPASLACRQPWSHHPSPRLPSPFLCAAEEEANAYFQRVYAGEISVEGLVGVLRGFKNSTLGREQEVFACMVHNLFDEYRFFPKYPDKELHTTGGGAGGGRVLGAVVLCFA